MNMKRYVLDGDDKQEDEYIFDEEAERLKEQMSEDRRQQEEYLHEETDSKLSLFHAKKACSMLERGEAQAILDKHKKNIDKILKRDGVKMPRSLCRVRVVLFTKEKSEGSMKVKHTLYSLCQKYNLEIKEIVIRSEKDCHRYRVYATPKTVIGGVSLLGTKNEKTFVDAIELAITNGTN